ncbi:hypothetical protein BPC006_II2724 [Burkholderia pseudomallei BPC006]|nr:hypothetical protein BPC006_II2724 [Burkholderia pseudomallei BPC006]EDO89170.1 hypothetical protein BURPSPAST_AC0164 [Burkholderia pseudomallei Pasteur 52237]
MPIRRARVRRRRGAWRTPRAGGRPVRVLLLPPQRPVARACRPLRVASGAASN